MKIEKEFLEQIEKHREFGDLKAIAEKAGCGQSYIYSVLKQGRGGRKIVGEIIKFYSANIPVRRAAAEELASMQKV